VSLPCLTRCVAASSFPLSASAHGAATRSFHRLSAFSV
jgi:hypothetical protein